MLQTCHFFAPRGFPASARDGNRNQGHKRSNKLTCDISPKPPITSCQAICINLLYYLLGSHAQPSCRMWRRQSSSLEPSVRAQNSFFLVYRTRQEFLRPGPTSAMQNGHWVWLKSWCIFPMFCCGWLHGNWQNLTGSVCYKHPEMPQVCWLRQHMPKVFYWNIQYFLAHWWRASKVISTWTRKNTNII